MLTIEQIKPFLDGEKPPASLLHSFREKALDLKSDLREIFGKDYPSYLDVSRPRERKEDKAYRKMIYLNPFAEVVYRVSEAYDYIRSAEDFSIEYPKDIPLKDETLEQYLSKSYCTDGSFSDWFFKNIPIHYLTDPNAVVFVSVPLAEINTSKTAYAKPRAMVASSENVLFHTNRFAVIDSSEYHEYTANGEVQHGKIRYFFDNESWTVAYQHEKGWRVLGYDPQKNALTAFPTYMDATPVFYIGKRLAETSKRGEKFYTSRLDDILPSVKEAQQVLSDRMIERNFHISSQEWRRGKSRCTNPNCDGGRVRVKDREGNVIRQDVCPKCKGTAINNSGSGLEIIWVDDTEVATLQGQLREKTTPSVAPGGYIERNIEPLKELRIEYKDLEDAVYRKLNLQYIIKNSYAAESGQAKREDREDSYRELSTTAEHLIQVMQNAIVAIDALRYGPAQKAKKQLPSILVPVRFNLENSELTRIELNDAKDKAYDSTLIETLEEKLLSFWAGKNSTVYKKFMIQRMLDPYHGYSADEKNVILSMIYTYQKEGPKRTEALKSIFFSIQFEAILSAVTIENPAFYDLQPKSQKQLLLTEFERVFEDIAPVPLQKEFANQAVRPAINYQDVQQIN